MEENKTTTPLGAHELLQIALHQIESFIADVPEVVEGGHPARCQLFDLVGHLREAIRIAQSLGLDLADSDADGETF